MLYWIEALFYLSLFFFFYYWKICNFKIWFLFFTLEVEGLYLTEKEKKKKKRR